jgi:hypothetical protein
MATVTADGAPVEAEAVEIEDGYLVVSPVNDDGAVEEVEVEDDFFPPPTRSTSTSDLPDDTDGLHNTHVLKESGFSPEAFLPTSAPVTIYTREEIVQDPTLLSMVRSPLAPVPPRPPPAPPGPLVSMYGVLASRSASASLRRSTSCCADSGEVGTML